MYLHNTNQCSFQIIRFWLFSKEHFNRKISSRNTKYFTVKKILCEFFSI